MHDPNQTATIRVWDPFIRLFHWALVISFTLAYLTEDELQTLHVYAGYLLTALIAARLIWGFTGPRHAKFSDFVRPPGEAIAYLRSMWRGGAKRYIGHNPAGGAMIVLLLGALLLTSLSGIILYGAEGGGPLAGYFIGGGEPLEEVHEFLANATLLLILLHLAGVVLGSLLHGENLVKAMVTGMKQPQEPPRA